MNCAAMLVRCALGQGFRWETDRAYAATHCEPSRANEALDTYLGEAASDHGVDGAYPLPTREDVTSGVAV